MNSCQAFDMGDLLIARRGDESVVLNVPNSTYLRLDSSATEILHLVQIEGRSGAAAAMAQRHGLAAEVANADVNEVLDRISTARSKRDGSLRRPDLRSCATVARQWARLPVRGKLAVLETTTLLLSVELAFRWFGIDTIARRVGAPLVSPRERPISGLPEIDVTQLSEHERRLFAAADWTLNRWVFDATCLRRALLYGWILRRRYPELHIGLMEEGDLVAHAWLTVDGCTLGGAGDVGDFNRMTPMPDQPPNQI